MAAPRLTSSSADLSTTSSTTSSTAPPTLPETHTDEAPIAPENQFVATVDDINWSGHEHPFDPAWNAEERERWRRSTYLEARFDAIETLLNIEAIDVAASLEANGMSPPYPSIKHYGVALHNNADHIIVTSMDGSTITLAQWFGVMDRLSASTVEYTMTYSDLDSQSDE